MRTSWFIQSAKTRRETSSMDTTRFSHGKHNPPVIILSVIGISKSLVLSMKSWIKSNKSQIKWQVKSNVKLLDNSKVQCQDRKAQVES